MRIAALFPALLLVTGGCMFGSSEEIPFEQPNSLMADEITSRVQQIPFQHRDELLQNLLWLAQTGETTIPAVLNGLDSDNPKVRSSCAWVLGRIHDRRTIPYLNELSSDPNQTVRLEVARALVLMGDLQQSPKLIEGLDSDRKEVRYLCHEALKSSTGRDFGYDHLMEDPTQRREAVLGWRRWWADYWGDQYFATRYEQQHRLGSFAAPMGEGQPRQVTQDPWQQDPQGQDPQGQDPGTDQPRTEDPNGDGTGTTEPNVEDPQQNEPQTGEPKTGEPQTGEPQTGEPKTGEPKTGEPQTGEPKTGEPKTGEPQGTGGKTGTGTQGGGNRI